MTMRESTFPYQGSCTQFGGFRRLLALLLSICLFSTLHAPASGGTLDVTNVELPGAPFPPSQTVPTFFISLSSHSRLAVTLLSGGQWIHINTFNPQTLDTSSITHNVSSNPLSFLTGCRTDRGGFILLGTPRDSTKSSWMQFYNSDGTLDPSSIKVELGTELHDPSIAFIPLPATAEHNLAVTFINASTSFVQLSIYKGLGSSFGSLLFTERTSVYLHTVSNPRVIDFRSSLGFFALSWIDYPPSNGATPWDRMPMVIMKQFYCNATTFTLLANYALNPSSDSSHNFTELKQLRLFESSGGRNLVAAWIRTKDGNIEAAFCTFPIFQSASTFSVIFSEIVNNAGMDWPAASAFEVSGTVKYLLATLRANEHKQTILSYAINTNNQAIIGGSKTYLLSTFESADYSSVAPGTFYMDGQGSDDSFFHALVFSASVQSKLLVASRVSWPSHAISSERYLSSSPLSVTPGLPSFGPVSISSFSNSDSSSYFASAAVTSTNYHVYVHEIFSDQGHNIAVLLARLDGSIADSWTITGLDCRRPSVALLDRTFLVVWDQSSGGTSREVRGQFFSISNSIDIGSSFLISEPSTNASMASMARLRDIESALRPNGFLVVYVDVTESSKVLARYIERSSSVYLGGSPIGEEVVANLFVHGQRVSFPQVARIGNDIHGMVLVSWLSQESPSSDVIVAAQYLNYLPNTRHFIQPYDAEIMVSPWYRRRLGDPAIPDGDFRIQRSNLKIQSFPDGPRVQYVYQESFINLTHPTSYSPSRVIFGEIYDGTKGTGGLELFVDNFEQDACNPSLTPFDGWQGKFSIVSWQRRSNVTNAAGLWYRGMYPSAGSGYTTSTSPVLIQEDTANSSSGYSVLTSPYYSDSSNPERQFAIFYSSSRGETSTLDEILVQYQAIPFVSQNPGLSPTKKPSHTSVILGVTIPLAVVLIIIMIRCLCSRCGCLDGKCCSGGGGGGGSESSHIMDNHHHHDHGSSWNNDSGSSNWTSDHTTSHHDSGSSHHHHDW